MFKLRSKEPFEQYEQKGSLDFKLNLNFQNMNPLGKDYRNVQDGL